MAKTKIQYCDKVWNPVTGCTKISDGCLNCYAEKMAKRLKIMGIYKNGFNVTLHEERLKIPYSWKAPSLIFVNSMSDLFHDSVTDEFLEKILTVIQSANQHTYLILTKRPERMCKFMMGRPFIPNLWLGVTIENEKAMDRINYLWGCNAYRFISFEPLLEKIEINHLSGIDWVIVGGETGAGAREMKEEWVLPILEMCKDSDIPFFFKQWGCKNKNAVICGKKYLEIPELILTFNKSN